MAQRTTPRQRDRFFRRHQAGETYQQIADTSDVSYECVRYWCRRQRRGGSHQSQYQRKSQGQLSTFSPLVRYGILRLRLEHPRWGPDVLRYHLEKRPSLQGVAVPSASSIGRYLRQWPRFRRQRKPRYPQKRPRQPTQVHECWQIDFKLGIALEQGIQVNLHTVRDPIGAACLTARLTAAGPVGRRVKRVKLAQLRQTVRQAFTHWGTLPKAIQTDNEALFVGQADDAFPSLFTLWLYGLGIRHRRIRAGVSTDNAEVERCHRTLYDYVLAGQQDKSLPHLQHNLDQAVDELAFDLSSHAYGCDGKPPVQAHPELLSCPRPYQPQHELALFDIDLVDAYLSRFAWRRKVGKTGQICIGGHHRYYSVGRDHARQSILVCFDPLDRHFVFYPDQSLADDQLPSGDELGRKPARGLSLADITGLSCRSSPLPPQQLPLKLLL